MSKHLIESILNNDLVTAGEIFESRLDDIIEIKLYEAKRRIAADMQEAAGGGLTLDQINARKRMGWRKASDVLPDPHDEPFELKVHSRVKPKKTVKMKKKKSIKEGMMPPPKTPNAAELKAMQDPKLKKIAARIRQRNRQKQASDMAAEPQSTTPKAEPEKVGFVKRNLNTLMGREPDYKPEPSKGGRVGKVARYLLTKDISG